MLVLSRKVGETVVIDENIRVVVVAVKGNQVRLGFIAPDDVSIRRSEVTPRLTADHFAEIAAEDCCTA